MSAIRCPRRSSLPATMHDAPGFGRCLVRGALLSATRLGGAGLTVSHFYRAPTLEISRPRSPGELAPSRQSRGARQALSHRAAWLIPATLATQGGPAQGGEALAGAASCLVQVDVVRAESGPRIMPTGSALPPALACNLAILLLKQRLPHRFSIMAKGHRSSPWLDVTGCAGRRHAELGGQSGQGRTRLYTRPVLEVASRPEPGQVAQ
jgi:hypothetical protein